MDNKLSDHADVLAAIAQAAEACGREPQPVTPPQQAPAIQNQTGTAYTAPTTNQATNLQQAPSPVPAAQPVALPTGPPPLSAYNGPTDEELKEVQETRDKKKFKLGMAVNLTILTILITPCLGLSVWYKSSEKNQQAFAELMGNFREVPNDVKGMANIKESYDEALAEVGAHGTAIDEATRALGVDPDEFEASTEKQEGSSFLQSQEQSQTMN